MFLFWSLFLHFTIPKTVNSIFQQKYSALHYFLKSLMTKKKNPRSVSHFSSHSIFGFLYFFLLLSTFFLLLCFYENILIWRYLFLAKMRNLQSFISRINISIFWYIKITFPQWFQDMNLFITWLNIPDQKLLDGFVLESFLATQILSCSQFFSLPYGKSLLWRLVCGDICGQEPL